MQYKKYQKLKAMQTFKQKFSEMIREYKDGFKIQNQEKKIVIVREL